MKAFLKSHCVAVFLLAVFFCLYTVPVRDGDFFWHVKTGQWIWQHRSLPTADPFSYTVGETNPFRPGSQRIPFILKQYWLGQLALFGVWQAAGEAGMVLLRALSYTGILAFLYFWMRRYSQGILPLAMLFLTGTMLQNYPNERPQLFAFIIAPALIYLLEKLRSDTPLPKSRLLLPLLMLLWANTHASFMLGDVLIFLYLASHLASVVFKKESFHKSRVLLLGGSIAITIINPNGYLPLVEFFSPVPAYVNSIYENITPFADAMDYNNYNKSFWLLIIIIAVTLGTRIRRMELVHILVLLSLAALSLTAVRYIPFLFLASPLLMPYLPKWQPGTIKTVSVMGILLAPTTLAHSRSILDFGAHQFFPADACRFINKVKPAGALFNYYDWGGYMMLNCPDYKVFVDGRGLIEEISSLHDQLLMEPSWKSILNTYKVNLIVIPGVETYAEKVLPITYKLQLDDEWVLVYYDASALVFARNIQANRQLINSHAIDKSMISEHIAAQRALHAYQ